MSFTPSHDPWSSAPTPLVVEPKTARRSRGWLIGVAAAVLVVAVGIAAVVGITLAGRRPAVADPEGQQACQIANNWNKSKPGFVDGSIAETIHSHSVHSSHAELVTRGDDLYDTWSTVEMQQLAGELTPAERDLRALVPLAAFRTACLQVGSAAN